MIIHNNNDLVILIILILYWFLKITLCIHVGSMTKTNKNMHLMTKSGDRIACNINLTLDLEFINKQAYLTSNYPLSVVT